MSPAGLREPSAQRIGPYEILVDIGSGGMGTISLACATGEPLGVDGFARLVAIKRPHFASAPEHEVLSRFLDEARLLAQVHHANVVGIHQIGADAGGHFLVLDYIEGGALDELCAREVLRRQKLPPPIVMRILADMLAGLHAVHEAAGVEGNPLGMLHRDVAAQNVLVGRDGVARLADFGIAKAIISSTVTDKAYLHGRLQYMAPEYLKREAVDRRLDVYAAGVTMWTALAGNVPWDGASEAQIVQGLMFEGVPPLSAAGVTIAPGIQAIVSRACDRARERRYPTARAMLEAIEDLGRHTGWIASHAEVAALVEELLGVELRARRAAIAQRLASPSAPAPAPLVAGRSDLGPTTVMPRAAQRAALAPTVPVALAQVTDVPAGPPAAVAAPLPSGPPASVTPLVPVAVPPATPQGRGVWIAVAVLAAALVGALAAWKLGAPVTADQASPADAPAGPTGSYSGSAQTVTSPPSTSAAPVAERPDPSLSGGPPSTTAAPSPQKSVAVPTARPSARPTGLPTAITTNNPYRPR